MFPQLGFRVELRGSKSKDFVGRKQQHQCHLPQCQTADTGGVQRDQRASGVGYAILCHENGEWLLFVCFSLFTIGDAGK